MAARFSNFEDEEFDSVPGSSSTAENGKGLAQASGNSVLANKSIRAPATPTAFDDFDGDWDSDAPSSAVRSSTAPQVVSATTRASKLQDRSEDKWKQPRPEAREESTSVELSNGQDLARRARELDLDEEFDHNRSFGKGRASTLADTSSRGSQRATPMRTFSASPSALSSDARISPNEHAAPSSRDNKQSEAHYDHAMPPMPDVEYEPISVEAPSHYQNYLYLLKYIHGLKILCAVHILVYVLMLVANQLYATVAIIFHMWYLLGGIVVAPFGFFAVHKLNRRLILIWGVAFAADALAEGIGALVYSSKTPEEGGGIISTLIHMTVVLIRAGLTYIIYRFWTKLPENAGEYFALFTSTPVEADRLSPV